MSGPNSDVAQARKLHAKLGLAQEFWPVARFGAPSVYGKIFLTAGNKIMKVTAWSKNSQREMRISKIASNANVGPRVYNTRSWSPGIRKNANEMAILELAPRRT